MNEVDLERFAPIHGYEGLYEISTFGNVISLARTTIPAFGKKQTTRSRLLSQHSNGNGYATVRLYKNNKLYIKYVHRLVLETFISECPAGMESCHNNGLRWNNHLSNLRWDSKKNNHADKFLHGTIVNGERARAAKLTTIQIAAIRLELAHGDKQRVIAKKFSVSQPTISDIANCRTWKHI